MMKLPSFMIIPDMSCQASCKYCFGPHKGPGMSQKTAEQTIFFISRIVEETKNNQSKINITFHGGEPLLRPFSWWKYFLQTLNEYMNPAKLRLSIQSNLWALTEETCELFHKYGVSIGTSLDGPEDICDRNRGEGYFQNTLRGIYMARDKGLHVGGIATISKQTFSEWKRIIDFYIDQNLNMNLHPAVDILNKKSCGMGLSAEEYSELLREIIPYYKGQRKRIAISTLDDFFKASINQHSVCTFHECSRLFLVISPEGLIYPCQRFCGNTEFALGCIEDNPSLEQLYASPAAKNILQREKEVSEECGDCEYYLQCFGGCYYNALASGNGIVDPLCEAYKKTFKLCRELLAEEMIRPENIKAIEEGVSGMDVHPLFREGDYISLLDKVHPAKIASNARKVLCFYALGRENSPVEAADYVLDKGICGDRKKTAKLMVQYQTILTQNSISLNNLYVHLTFRCNLSCPHCYSSSGNTGGFMNVEAFKRLGNEALEAGFRQLVITGGEPLIHPEFKKLAEFCKAFRGRGMKFVLRTNFTGHFDDVFLEILAESFDQIVVSMDGDKESHEKIRGIATFDLLKENLIRYQQLSIRYPFAAECSLACTLGSEELKGNAGDAVRQFAKELGIKRTRFKPVLPIGRAESRKGELQPSGLKSYLAPGEILKGVIKPVRTCGIGQNIYIEPNGNAFPCYACHTSKDLLGNVISIGLDSLIKSPEFICLSKISVDKIEKCRDCDLRYLCGGICRAWSDRKEDKSWISAPENCDNIKKDIIKLMDYSFRYLGLEPISS